MLAIAIAIAFASFVGALAYAAPKFYWYRTQAVLIVQQSEDEKDRFLALKESHDLEVVGSNIPQLGQGVDKVNTPGQYL